MIILIASGSILISYFIATATPLGSAIEEPVNVKTIERIDTSVSDPDEKIFNSNAINPSVEVQIAPESDSSESQN